MEKAEHSARSEHHAAIHQHTYPTSTDTARPSSEKRSPQWHWHTLTGSSQSTSAHLPHSDPAYDSDHLTSAVSASGFGLLRLNILFPIKQRLSVWVAHLAAQFLRQARVASTSTGSNRRALRSASQTIWRPRACCRMWADPTSRFSSTTTTLCFALCLPRPLSTKRRPSCRSSPSPRQRSMSTSRTALSRSRASCSESLWSYRGRRR